jgi:hypothetical protein
MPSMQFHLSVEMEGQEPFVVVADQRDLAKLEVQDFYQMDGVKHLTVRYLAWSAAFRQGLTKLEWLEFELACIEAVDQEAAEEPKNLDPTQPDQSGENS